MSRENSVTIVHPGTQHAPRLAAELHRRGLLQEFWSGFAFGEDAAWLRILPESLSGRLGGRICRGVPDKQIRCRPLLEWAALRAMRRGQRGEDVFYERNRRFQESIPQSTIAQAGVVAGFDTSSWILAQRCQQAKVPFVLEQTVAHPAHKQRVLAEASRQFPEWAENDLERPPRLLQAERAEHTLADRIVVGSGYCRDTLVAKGVAAEKIVVNPYGAERGTVDADSVPKVDRPRRPLRFVFLGFLSLRKGVPLLLDAWKKAGLRDAELVLAGGIREEHRKLLLQAGNVRYAGFVPRSNVPHFLAEHDVYVLPSYSEGFAISIIEAMAAGLPIISSTNTGAPDIVTSGRDGFVIPVGDVDPLVDRLRWFSDNRDKIDAMSIAAKQKAKEYTWERYGERWEAMLQELQTSF